MKLRWRPEGRGFALTLARLHTSAGVPEAWLPRGPVFVSAAEGLVR